MSGPPPWDSRHPLTDDEVRKQNRAVLDAVLASAKAEPAGVRESLHAHAEDLMRWADELLAGGWPRYPYSSTDFADVDGVLVPDPMKLGVMLQHELTGALSAHARRVLAQEQTALGWLSTVFLNHGLLREDGVLLVYETMLFGREDAASEDDRGYPIACWRYPSRRDAEEGHRRVVEAIAKGAAAESLPTEQRQMMLTEAH